MKSIEQCIAETLGHHDHLIETVFALKLFDYTKRELLNMLIYNAIARHMISNHEPREEYEVEEAK